MRRLFPALLTLALVTPAGPADEAPPNPAEAFKKLQEEFLAKLEKAKSAGDVAAFQKLLKEYTPRFLEFAEKHSKDPAGLDAAIYVLRMSGTDSGKDSPSAKALALIARDYVQSEKMASLVAMLGGRGGDASASLLNAIMDKNPDQKIQAKACQALIKARENDIQLAGRIKDNEKLREQLVKFRGEDYVKGLEANADKYKEEVAQLKKTLDTKYEGVIPNLAVGKKAPEVVSEDLDGKVVKLSDLKGKVVVLDIWATWCGPCRAMIPHERKLVERLKGKPFALVSISADAKKETLTNFLKKEPMPWPHWWNGATGGILSDWDVQYFPTIYVLDAKGVIRYEDVRGEKMDEAVDALLKEMEESKKEE